MKIQHVFGWLLRSLSFIAVVGVLILATSILFYSMYEIFTVIKTILKDFTTDAEIILKALKAVDMVLLGIVFFIMGVGLFELFVGKVDNLPQWLHIKDIDQLKGMLIKVAIVVIGVSFTGRVVTWDGEADLMGYGIGLGAVIFALSYFINVKQQAENGKS
ncbi:MAG: YqhA family protein [Bacteroidota bacterium]